MGEDQARVFHHSVVHLIFTSSRTRNDIHSTMAFLATRVASPDEDDWIKLKRLLKYLRGTTHMPLILKDGSLSIVKWWIDTSCAAHGDCKGHTGTTMSMRK
jgi:hypothetical protein